MTQDTPSTNGYYVQLKRRILINILLPAFIPLLLVSIVILMQFSNSYEAKVRDHLAQLMLKHKHDINTFLQERLANIKVVADKFTFDQLSRQDFLHQQLQILRENFDNVFVDLGLVDYQGQQVAYAGPFQLQGADYSNAKWFSQSLRKPQTISDVFTGKRGFPHFIVTVKRQSNGRSWILRATINFKIFNTLVQETQIGKTGFAFILNHDAEFQTKPIPDINPQKEPYPSLMQDMQDEIRVQNFKGQSGDEHLFVTTALKNGEWILMFQQKASEAFAQLRRSIFWAGAIILLGGFGIVSMALMLSQRMIKHIQNVNREKEALNAQIVESGKMAAIGELAAGIAHEINNPVAIMIEEAGWIGDIMSDEGWHTSENEAEIRRSLSEIATQGKRSKNITHKLLSFARKTDAVQDSVDVRSLLQEILGFVTQRAKSSGIEISSSVPADLPVVRASPSELQQVFLNLINNALDAMDQTGGSLHIEARRKGEFVIVSLQDTGPGIPEKDLQRIFEPFYTTKPQGKGTGLGLSICYGIMQRSGGTIGVVSEVGRGSTFTVSIPAVQEIEAR